MFFFLSLIYNKNNSSIKRAYVQKNEHQAEQYEWIKPPIHIKPIHGEKPYKKETLPIPEKEIKSIIQIEIPKNHELNHKLNHVDLIIDKENRVYTTTDTPKEVKIKQTHIKSPEIGFCFKPGIGITAINTYDYIWKKNKVYFLPVFSLSFYRFKDIYIGTSVLWLNKYVITDNYYGQKHFLSLNGGVEWILFKTDWNHDEKTDLKIGCGGWYKIIGSEELPKFWVSLGFKF